MNPAEVFAALQRAAPEALSPFLHARRARVFQHIRGAVKPSAPLPQKPKEGWFSHFQTRAAPGPTERGFRASQPLAARLLDAALSHYEDPVFAQIWQLGNGGGDDDWMPLEAEDEDADVYGWRYEDLPDLLHVPASLPSGARLTPVQRFALAEQAVMAAGKISEGWPRWLVEPILENVYADHPLQLVAVPKEEAVDFVARHHSKLPKLNTRGLMYALGIVAGQDARRGRLVAVATAGTPTGRWADPHRVLELTRVASDRSTKGASSMLVARLLDLVQDSRRFGAEGPALFVTYSLSSEEGTTYAALRDKGLRPVAFEPGKARAGGARPHAELSLADVDKIRWEAGPGARPAHWELLARVGGPA